MKTNWLVRASAGIAALVVTTSCDAPFSLNITHVNESGPQRNAVIALSDPQVYTRERLLNDRNADIQYLLKQLTDMDTKDFTPRLKRDIDQMTEVAIALSAKFNPVAGANVAQNAEITKLENDVQIERLKNLLADVKAQQTPADASAVGTTPAATDASSLAASAVPADLLAGLQTLVANAQDPTKRQGMRQNTVSSATPIDELRDKLAYRNEIESNLEQAQLDDRHDLNGNALYRLQFRATIFPGQVKDKYGIARLTILPPRFEGDQDVSRLYLDWLSYVASQLNPASDDTEIDPAIANRYGLLGPATGIYGIAYLPYAADTAAGTGKAVPAAGDEDGMTTFLKQVVPPDANYGACDQRIKQLLTSDVAGQLASAKDQQSVAVPIPPSIDVRTVWLVGTSECAAKEVAILNAAADALEQARYTLKLTDADGQACSAVEIVGQGAKPALLRSISPADSFQKLATLLATESLKQDQDLAKINASPTVAIDNVEKLRLAITFARNLWNLTPTYLLAIERVKARHGGQIEDLNALSKSLFDLKVAAGNFLSTVRDHLEAPAENDAAPACASFADVAGRVWVPGGFYWSVTDKPDQHYPASKTANKAYAGPTYAYSTAPAELAQRVSTVASATQALDLMAAVSAIIPQAGAGLNASGELRHIATGRVDTIESAPLIVGFSNSGAANQETNQYGAEQSEPSFGWVFGPKVIADPGKAKLELSQVLVEQPVTADISVPGWWHSVRLRVETAWAANFEKSVLLGQTSDKTQQPSNRSTDYMIEVPLQTNPGSYEQLTEFLANQTWGLQYKTPVITDVNPKTLPACKNVTVLVSGTDLWRGNAVYVGGNASTGTQIMPDMNGLAATFDLSQAAQGPTTLTVWTQLGQARSQDVTIVPAGACAAKPEQPAAPPTATFDGPPVLIPIADYKTPVFTLTLAKEAPDAGYRILLQRPKHPTLQDHFDANIVRDADAKVFHIAWPDLTKMTAFAQIPPTDGEPFTVQLIQVNQDTSTVVLAQLPTLYYYSSPLDQLFKANAQAKKSAVGTYAVSIKTANAASALGKSVDVAISGVQDGNGNNLTATISDQQVDDKGVSFTVKLTSGPTADQTAHVVLTFGKFKFPSFDVKLPK